MPNLMTNFLLVIMAIKTRLESGCNVLAENYLLK